MAPNVELVQTLTVSYCGQYFQPPSEKQKGNELNILHSLTFVEGLKLKQNCAPLSVLTFIG